MKKFHFLLITSFIICLLSFFLIYFINNVTKNRFIEYSTMIASKITKYVVNAAYNDGDFDFGSDNLYDMIKGSDGDIKTIIYDTGEVNKLLNIVTNNVYDIFNKLENSDLKGLNIRENILVNKKSNFDNGLVLEVPFGMVSNNYLLANLGPKIPIKISLTGELESQLSTEVKEYGINNALISIDIDIRVIEQITMPFVSEKVVIDNKIPVTIKIINGKIPNYYLNGFDKASNLYSYQ